ncbi:MAG TPA: hypothetical protein VFL07_06010 [Rudaea sp.]|nr:hypothetical protein [Rudaea sp.]
MHAIRATGYLLLAFFASHAGASDFAISPNISGGFGNYKWSIAVGSTAATGNPTLYLARGRSYTFAVTTSLLHPFWIDDAPGFGGVTPYSGTGLSANGADSNTTLTFDVPDNAPEVLYYACANHSEMHGTINLVVFRDGFD